MPRSDAAAHLLAVSKEKRLKTAKAWAKEGVDVGEITGDHPTKDHETSLSFIRGDRYGEITTANYQWQRRIEALGCKPRSITTFSDSKAQIRWYDRVPKAFMRKPSAGRQAGEESDDE